MILARRCTPGAARCVDVTIVIRRNAPPDHRRADDGLASGALAAAPGMDLCVR
jgi:hypothetical protein